MDRPKNPIGYMTENTGAEMLVALESTGEPYEIQVSHQKINPIQNDEGYSTFHIDMTSVSDCTKKIYIWDSVRGMKPLVPSVVIQPQ